MSSRIYAKLAVTNIKNNGKTYVPFMLTAVLTVMMYYMMDTLARNDSIGNRNVTTVLFLTIPVMTLFFPHLPVLHKQLSHQEEEEGDRGLQYPGHGEGTHRQDAHR